MSPAARSVQIHSVDVVSWQMPDLVVDVVCSKGTYIRSLARDLGRSLGSGGYLAALLRTASGQFTLADSVTLGEIARSCRLGYLETLCYPLDMAVADWPVLLLDAAAVGRIHNGLSWLGPNGRIGEDARAIDLATGRLVALLTYTGTDVGWQPKKVFDEGAAA